MPPPGASPRSHRESGHQAGNDAPGAPAPAGGGGDNGVRLVSGRGGMHKTACRASDSGGFAVRFRVRSVTLRSQC
jgi:hypothetical protein